MLKNIGTDQLVDCYYRELGNMEAKDYKPPSWFFNFYKELKEGYKIFALETKEYPGEAQGIISLKPLFDGFYAVEVKSVETAHVNKKIFVSGRNKGQLNLNRKYRDVSVNLIAFACQYSLEQGLDGFVYLKSKSNTIDLYTEKLNGTLIDEAKRLIVFDEVVGKKIAGDFFPGGAIQWVK
jgi:hypothetical protein